MDTISFIQQIKQKQEQLKNTLKTAHPAQHKRETSDPSSVTARQMDVIMHTSPPPRVQQHTPLQPRVKHESDHSASPLIFRTPQVSLHQPPLNSSNLRYPQDQSEIRNRGQQSVLNYRSQLKSSSAAVEAYQTQLEVVTEHQQQIRDYQLVLEEVMKKYRAQQIELLQKNRELARTDFYKKELIKEKQRNQALRERNSLLKSKLLKLIEVVQVHLLEENQYTAELEEQQMSFAVQNQTLRNLLCLDGPIPTQEDDEVILEERADPSEQEVIDKVLQAMLQDLDKAKADQKQRATLQNTVLNNLTLTVTNRQTMIDFEEERLMKSQPSSRADSQA